MIYFNPYPCLAALLENADQTDSPAAFMYCSCTVFILYIGQTFRTHLYVYKWLDVECTLRKFQKFRNEKKWWNEGNGSYEITKKYLSLLYMYIKAMFIQISNLFERPNFNIKLWSGT